MIFKKIVLTIICILSVISSRNDKTDLEKYLELKINDVNSIKESDLPSEFCDKAFNIVDEFIRKTINLDYEILILFDYINGEILTCKIGNKTSVKLDLDNENFKGMHLASIHNHTKDMYSPPSDKNFGIFSRTWEDYELIAGQKELWILKGKLKNNLITFELKVDSKILFRIASESASLKYKNQNEMDEECDELYGKLLSNYINDKNLKDIQLEKKEYHNDRTNN